MNILQGSDYWEYDNVRVRENTVAGSEVKEEQLKPL
jgi:hypothetical protein